MCVQCVCVCVCASVCVCVCVCEIVLVGVCAYVGREEVLGSIYLVCHPNGVQPIAIAICVQQAIP